MKMIGTVKRDSLAYRMKSTHSEMLSQLSEHLKISKTKLLEMMIEATMEVSAKSTFNLPHEIEIINKLHAFKELCKELSIKLENINLKQVDLREFHQKGVK